MKNNPLTKKELDMLEIDMRNFKNLIENFIKHKEDGNAEEFYFGSDIINGIGKLHLKYILKKKRGVIKF